MPSHPWEHRDDLLPIDPDLSPDDAAEPSPEHRPSPQPHEARRPSVLASIGAGGFLGTLARYEVERILPVASGHFPWATFAINISGSLLLGSILTYILETVGLTRFARTFLCVGVLGSWTTMSTFAGESDLLVRSGHAAMAIAYCMATVVGGVAATWLGIASARRAVLLSARRVGP